MAPAGQLAGFALILGGVLIVVRLRPGPSCAGQHGQGRMWW
jgi:hypothetical protein